VATKEPKQETKTETAFTKQQILAAAKYTERRDLLAVLLEDGKSYTLAEVNAAITEFMKKEVK
jgi:hypothetical protein